jgi:hypothetical protein
MSSAGSQLKERKVALVRILITINFVLFLVLISPLGRSRELYRAIRDAGFGALATTGLPVWFALTTLIATALHFWRKVRKQDVVEQPLPKRTLDGVLLLAWWIVLVVACLYAFMVGMGS